MLTDSTFTIWVSARKDWGGGGGGFARNGPTNTETVIAIPIGTLEDFIMRHSVLRDTL